MQIPFILNNFSLFFFFSGWFLSFVALKLSAKWDFNLSLLMNGRSVVFDFSFALFPHKMKWKYFYNFHKHFRSHPVSVVEQFGFCFALLYFFPSWGSKQQLSVSLFDVLCARNIWNWFLSVFSTFSLRTSCIRTIVSEWTNEKKNSSG